MATMLRHVPTGDLYPINENLARRDDMVEYVPPPEGGVDKPKAKPKAKKAEPVVQADDLDLSDLADELDTLE